MDRIDIKLKAYGLSIFLHSFLLLFLLLLTSIHMEQNRVVEIDLSLGYFKMEKQAQEKQVIRQEKNIKSYKTTPVKQDSSHTTNSIKEDPSLAPSQAQEVSQKTSQIDEAKIGQDTHQKAINQATGNQSKDKEAIASKDVKKESIGSLNKEQSQEMYIKEKLSIISSIVQKNISYPPLARKMGWEGKVIICIHLRSDGSLEDVKIERSSGYDLLDRNALETVKKVAHLFPRPPVDVIVRLPVSYKLE
jgi:protein TonB